MSRYHFDLLLGEHLVRDVAGTDLPDDDAARSYAASDMRVLSVTHKGIFDHSEECAVNVLDDAGKVLFRVPFSEVCRNALGAKQEMMSVVESAADRPVWKERPRLASSIQSSMMTDCDDDASQLLDAKER